MKLFKKIQGGIYGGIGFVLVVGITGFAYAALSSLTATDSETLTAVKWNNLVEHAVPSGAVISFFGDTCPTGWNNANGSGDERKTDGTLGTLDLRGEFIRGLDDGRGVDSGRGLASFQADNFEAHKHIGGWAGVNASASYGVVTVGASGNLNSQNGNTTINHAYTSTTGGTETRPRNIALLYCVKD